MKRTYRPSSNWDDDQRTHVPTCTVVQAEPMQQFSGLLDAAGNKLMVTVTPEPVGFVHFNGSTLTPVDRRSEGKP